MGRKVVVGMTGVVAFLMPTVVLAQTQDRVSATEKGSLLIYPAVEVRTQGSTIDQDTFISITNDSPTAVSVQMYFVQGDTWQALDNQIELTGNQPAYWSVATGLGTVNVSPWSALGYFVDADHSCDGGAADANEYMGRGAIYAWAVDALTNLEITHNHLSGAATTVNYEDGAAWEYNAYAYARLGGTSDASLDIDGTEYVQNFSQLLINFQAAGSAAFGTGATAVVQTPDLTLMPVSIDFTDGGLPVYTKAHFDVWNENEVKFSGAYRCIICWDQTLLEEYGVPNHFKLMNLQTDHGKARVDGLASPLCPDYTWNGNILVSEDASLLGVQCRLMDIGGYCANAGGNLIGMGYENAEVNYLPLGEPDEAPAFSNPIESTFNFVQMLKGLSKGR